MLHKYGSTTGSLQVVQGSFWAQAPRLQGCLLGCNAEVADGILGASVQASRRHSVMRGQLHVPSFPSVDMRPESIPRAT
eukprot:355669-Chlamydomonas_euryale.AAC.6